ncbi:homoserine kinase [Streptococcus pseudoporcinus]|uniref:Homoserine kinase n=1 Tax=Streptococcus pseudoporcinus TaxID=361101 RepID=A0A4U9YKB3_9STRE|nr:homoserine kinase [Streptococcus pseudoporcinus]VTS26826.1 homoserine kinase [Streptococcus pseudoporcinus]
MIIKVPATSANIGPGFDSIGIAVSKYLEVEVLEEATEWFIEHTLDGLPNDDRNLLVQTVLRVAPNVQPRHLIMRSDIPLARGLGSSSAVTIAGIELANQLADLQLSMDRKFELANQFEGHPDNVAPALFGQFVIASQLDNQLDYIQAPFPAVGLVAFIPHYELKTSDSRNVLPNQLSYKQAVSASSVANLAIAALLKGDMVKAGRAIENDHFHEVYRQKLVKEFHSIKARAKAEGAYATYLSGAGPTVMTLCPKEKVDSLLEHLGDLPLNGELVSLEIDKKGLQVFK